MVRLIPRLDIKGPNLVKGIQLEGLRVLGRPEAYARHYYETGADELLFMDIVASLYERNSILPIVSRVADEIFIPLTVGGGLRSIDDISAVLRSGADKVTLNTAAIRRPELITEAARRFGSSTIVVSVEAIRKGDRYEAFTDNGREITGLDAVEWAAYAAKLGAGEIMITSVDREGTGLGYDTDLIRMIAGEVDIPLIASGGAGSAAHVADAWFAGASAVAVGAVLHYNFLKTYDWSSDEFAHDINLAHLQRRGFGRHEEASIPAIKSHLAAHGIPARIIRDSVHV